MSDREALYAAILAHPDDDTPRLVFADWLQEHGDELQAEFIRSQIREYREPWGEAALRDRYKSSESRVFYEPPSPVTALETESWCVSHVRGFPSEVREGYTHKPDDPKWLDRLPELLRLAPIDTILLDRAHEATRSWSDVVTNPLFQHIRALNSGFNRRSLSDVRALVSSPHAGNLLDLRITPDSDQAAVAFLKSRLAKNLAQLTFVCSQLGADTALAFAAMLPKSKLRRLVVYGSPEIWDAMCATLPPKLESFEFFTSAFGKRGLAPFARALRGSALRSLGLKGPISIADAKALADAEGLSGLNRLYLGECKLKNTGIQALAKSAHLSNLLTLFIHENPLGDTAGCALANSPNLRNLLVLHARYCDFGDAVCEALLNAPFAANMLSLDILNRRGRVSPVMKRKLKRRYRDANV